MSGGPRSNPDWRWATGSSVADISAVLVTRGDCDLAPILESISFSEVDDVVIWDNSVRPNLSVYGRYAGMLEAKHELIYVQDDDTLVPVQDLIDAYDGGRLCNMPPSRTEYTDSSLLGWGAIFPQADADEAFELWPGPVDLNDCDIIFTVLKPFQRVDVGCEYLPWYDDPHRMFHQADHYSRRAEILRKARMVRDQARH